MKDTKNWDWYDIRVHENVSASVSALVHAVTLTLFQNHKLRGHTV